MKMLFKRKNAAKDDECRFLSGGSLQPCVCAKDKTGNMTKMFMSEEMANWEIYVHGQMQESLMLPDISIDNHVLTYKTRGKVSLRTYLTCNSNINTTLLLNELFSFVNTFRHFRFLHGNLHLDNIFMDNVQNANKFYLIDYANSYVISKRVTYPLYKRTSFIGEYEYKTQSQNFVYWDFLTIYVSLKTFFKKTKELVSLDTVMKSYVKNDVLETLLEYYHHTR